MSLKNFIGIRDSAIFQLETSVKFIVGVSRICIQQGSYSAAVLMSTESMALKQLHGNGKSVGVTDRTSLWSLVPEIHHRHCARRFHRLWGGPKDPGDLGIETSVEGPRRESVRCELALAEGTAARNGNRPARADRCDLDIEQFDGNLIRFSDRASRCRQGE